MEEIIEKYRKYSDFFPEGYDPNHKLDSFLQNQNMSMEDLEDMFNVYFFARKNTGVNHDLDPRVAKKVEFGTFRDAFVKFIDFKIEIILSTRYIVPIYVSNVSPRHKVIFYNLQNDKLAEKFGNTQKMIVKPSYIIDKSGLILDVFGRPKLSPFRIAFELFSYNLEINCEGRYLGGQYVVIDTPAGCHTIHLSQHFQLAIQKNFGKSIKCKRYYHRYERKLFLDENDGINDKTRENQNRWFANLKKVVIVRNNVCEYTITDKDIEKFKNVEWVFIENAIVNNFSELLKLKKLDIIYTGDRDQRIELYQIKHLSFSTIDDQIEVTIENCVLLQSFEVNCTNFRLYGLPNLRKFTTKRGKLTQKDFLKNLTYFEYSPHQSSSLGEYNNFEAIVELLGHCNKNILEVFKYKIGRISGFFLGASTRIRSQDFDISDFVRLKTIVVDLFCKKATFSKLPALKILKTHFYVGSNCHITNCPNLKNVTIGEFIDVTVKLGNVEVSSKNVNKFGKFFTPQKWSIPFKLDSLTLSTTPQFINKFAHIWKVDSLILKNIYASVIQGYKVSKELKISKVDGGRIRVGLSSMGHIPYIEVTNTHLSGITLTLTNTTTEIINNTGSDYRGNVSKVNVNFHDCNDMAVSTRNIAKTEFNGCNNVTYVYKHESGVINDVEITSAVETYVGFWGCDNVFVRGTIILPKNVENVSKELSISYCNGVDIEVDDNKVHKNYLTILMKACENIKADFGFEYEYLQIEGGSIISMKPKLESIPRSNPIKYKIGHTTKWIE